MATARKLPSGKWRVRLYIKGHDPEYVSFTSDGTDRTEKNTVEKRATEYKEMWERTQQKPTDMTVGEAIDEYIANRSAILSPSTIRGYKRDRNRYLQGIMGIKLVALTQPEVQNATNADARKISPKTIRNIHGLLSATLAEYRPDFRLKTSLPARKKKAKEYAPKDEDVRRLIKATQGKRLQKAIILGSCVTMRRSEISAVMPEDFDTEKHQLTIQRAMVQDDNNKWVLKDPKTYESTRVADVAPEVMDALLVGAVPGQRLVGLMPGTITGLFCELRKTLGIKIRFHDLRAYSASVQHALGVPDEYIMKQGGWSSDHVMKKIYRRAMEERAKEAAEKTSAHFSSLLESEDV